MMSIGILGQTKSNERMQFEKPLFEDVSEGRHTKKERQILEDSEGYIWVATTNGVERFDGIEYVLFGNNTDPNSKDNHVCALCEDKKTNRIYAALAQRNEIMYIDKNDYTTHIISIGVKGGNTYTNAFAMACYDDSLLIIKSNGLYLINKNNGHRKGPYDKEKAKSITGAFIEIDGKLYTSSTGCLEVIESRPPDTIITRGLNTLGYDVNSMQKQDDSTIIVTASKTKRRSDEILAKYNIKDDTFTKLHLLGRFPNFVTCANDGVWIGANARPMQFYNYEKDTLLTYTTHNTTINDNKCSGLLKLRNQPIIYISTPVDGLCKVDYNCSKFNIIDLRHFCASSSGRMFTVFKDSHGDIWLWLLDGMYMRKKNELHFQKVEFENKKLANALAVYQIIEDTTPQQEALYMVKKHEIFKYSYRTHKETQLNIPIPNGEYIVRTVIHRRKLYCICNTGSVFIIDLCTNSITTKTYDSEKTGTTHAAHLDGDSVVWLGNAISQLFSFNLKTGETTHHATTGMLDERVQNITERTVDGKREIWIAAQKNGLFCYQPDKRHLSHIENCRMLSEAVYNVVVDNCNNVWASTHSGLVCQEFKNKTVHEYGAKLGLDIEYMSTVQCKTSDGTILLGGVNTLVEFNSSEESAENDYFPTPKVVSYQYFNATSLFYDELTDSVRYNVSDTIHVPQGVRSVRLNARMFNHSQPKNNTIMWRMPRISENWLSINTSTPIFCSVLNHGINIVELQSCDAKGKPTGNIRTVYIYKEVFFYEHPLFRIMVIILGVLGVIVLLVYRSHKEKLRRKMLEAEVERQSGEIIKSNEQLMIQQARIEQQNTELRNHSAVLEREVADRTADLETARQKAEESSRLKSAFLANLSHEVRTPMNCIVGFSKLLVDPSCSREEQVEFAHLIQESSNGMLVLIGDLLDVSRIESGQLRVNFGEFDLMKELDDVYHMLFVERKKADVAFELHADEELNGLIINSDKDRFRQIIINITYNAFKFTEMGHVHIHADKCKGDVLSLYGYPKDLPPVEGDIVLVRIEDSGIGIPADKLDVIFEPFRKLNNNKTLYPGLGLGLNIVKNLVRLLHGQIWVTSIEGQGTTFHFFLPL